MKKAYSSRHIVSEPQRANLLLAVDFVGYRQFLAAFCPAGGQYAATIGGLHAFTETMLVVSLSVVRLECSFHCCYAVLFCCYRTLGCKNSKFFRMSQAVAAISAFFAC